ncbi:hypothetical protein ACIBQ3_29840 [Streptomyces rubiginosohelvolus]|uniref:hypothetical protein n=1 Tax=Streptomyces rubiginosohelvolus TaxID=67362 RepID=UPI0037A8542A
MSDGSKLHEVPSEKKGACFPDDVAGDAARLLVTSKCLASVDSGKNYGQVRELDPKGKHRVTFDARDKGFEECAGAGSGGNIQPCRGASVDKGLIMLGGQDRAGAYDVKTGKFLWGIKSDGLRYLYPLRAEDGRSMRIYEAAGPSTPGRTFLLGPRGAGTETNVVKHPAATAAWGYEMFMGHTAYVDGRLVLTSTIMSGDENKSRCARPACCPSPPHPDPY